MIPNHVQEEYKKMTEAQRIRFHELVAWAGTGEITGGNLPVDYNAIIEMVRRSGEEPVVPIPPIIPDDPELNQFKSLKKD